MNDYMNWWNTSLSFILCQSNHSHYPQILLAWLDVIVISPLDLSTDKDVKFYSTRLMNFTLCVCKTYGKASSIHVDIILCKIFFSNIFTNLHLILFMQMNTGQKNVEIFLLRMKKFPSSLCDIYLRTYLFDLLSGILLNCGRKFIKNIVLINYYD